ncbi:LytR C-terminal domain-containing protein [Isoptericola halotolerans]|uniref:LytR/CpsA/Psr regulator C-terminal domain-containing protein n=1 Tax=Isoptericola halotolerans TaxID=300560 RepID=A0ABX2A5S6_9MICO|nr:hypothetical protein [Isoptericola halotolerans]
MTKSQYPYPPDEFDVRGPEGAPVGVHREPRSGWSSAWPFLLVAVVFAGLGVGIISYLSDGGESPTENPPAASEQSADPEGGEGSGDGEEDPEGDEGAAGDEDADSEDGASEDDGDDAGSEDGTEDEADEEGDLASLVAAADTGAFVRVLNDDSGVAGEAGRGADALEAMGFSNTEATNYDGDSGQTTNVVWYAEGRAETAAAVAAALGVSAEQTSQQPLANGDVVVVVKEALAIAE